MKKRAGLAVLALLALVGCPKNKPPMTPVLEGPTLAQRGDSVRLWAHSYDPDLDSLSYLFDWGDGTESGWSAPVVSEATGSLGHMYADTGRYGARVKAKDATHQSGWSDTLFFNVGEYGPYPPHRPSGPGEIQVGDSAAFVTLADHPLHRNVAYQFDWGDTLGGWSGFVQTGELFKARHAYTRTGRLAVRARAKDNLDHVSDWSLPESVAVVDTFDAR